MNSLSWLIYFAGVSGNLQAVLMVIAVILAGFTGLRCLVTAIHNDDYPKDTPWTYPRLGPALTVAAGFAILAAIVPSQGTVYAIAASEVGEKVVTSERVQGMTDDAARALHQWIKRQIEPEKAK